MSFKYGIGKSIFLDLWDFESQRTVTKKSSLKLYIKIDPHIEVSMENVSSRIDHITKEYKKIVNNFELNDQEVDFNEIRNRVDEKYKQVKSSLDRPPTLTEFIKKFVDGIEKGDILISFGPNRGQRNALGATKNYKGFQEQFKLSQKSRMRSYDFEDIAIHFYNQFVEFFTLNSSKI